MDTSIQDLLAATLAELGLPAPTNGVPTILMRDGYFVGWKFHQDSYFVGWKLRYDGGYAIWLADGSAIEFYDEQGKLLRTVGIETEKAAA
jgi:hypothetical protein